MSLLYKFQKQQYYYKTNKVIWECYDQAMVNLEPMSTSRLVRLSALVVRLNEKPEMGFPFNVAPVGVPCTPRMVTVFNGGLLAETA